MRIFVSTVLLSLCALFSSLLAAEELTGQWQPEGQTAIVEIVFEKGVGTGVVLKNDNKPGAVGRVLIKNIVSDSKKPGRWHCEIYAERFKEFKKATLTLPKPDEMRAKVKVGFMSKTIKWARIESSESADTAK